MPVVKPLRQVVSVPVLLSVGVLRRELVGAVGEAQAASAETAAAASIKRRATRRRDIGMLRVGGWLLA